MNFAERSAASAFCTKISCQVDQSPHALPKNISRKKGTRLFFRGPMIVKRIDMFDRQPDEGVGGLSVLAVR